MCDRVVTRISSAPACQEPKLVVDFVLFGPFGNRDADELWPAVETNPLRVSVDLRKVICELSDPSSR